MNRCFVAGRHAIANTVGTDPGFRMGYDPNPTNRPMARRRNQQQKVSANRVAAVWVPAGCPAFANIPGNPQAPMSMNRPNVVGPAPHGRRGEVVAAGEVVVEATVLQFVISGGNWTNREVVAAAVAGDRVGSCTNRKHGDC